MSCPKLSKKYWQPNSPAVWVSTCWPMVYYAPCSKLLNVVTHYNEYVCFKLTTVRLVLLAQGGIVSTTTTIAANQ